MLEYAHHGCFCCSQSCSVCRGLPGTIVVRRVGDRIKPPESRSRAVSRLGNCVCCGGCSSYLASERENNRHMDRGTEGRRKREKATISSKRVLCSRKEEGKKSCRSITIIKRHQQHGETQCETCRMRMYGGYRTRMRCVIAP